MKYAVLSVAAVVFVAVACSNKDFEFSGKSLMGYDSRGGTIVDGLFFEACKDDDKLMEIRKAVAAALTDSKEANAAVSNHRTYYEGYFQSANEHAGTIEDSVLQNKVQLLLQRRLDALHRDMSTHSHLAGEIVKQAQGLQEQYTTLKILATLPMIEQHAKDEKPVEQELRELKKHIQQLESRIKKMNQPQL